MTLYCNILNIILLCSRGPKVPRCRLRRRRLRRRRRRRRHRHRRI